MNNEQNAAFWYKVAEQKQNGCSRWLSIFSSLNSERVCEFRATEFAGLIHHAKLPFGHKGSKINNYNAVSVTSCRILRTGIQCLPVRRVGTTYTASVGKDHHQLSFDDEVPQEPFLLNLFKETVWSLRSIFIFLLEQPSQLKYIEWPGFRSTLKTATLTLVLVALLIVALSSTDSALSYLLALILRRTP